METKYAERGKLYRLDYSIRKAEGLFSEAISDMHTHAAEQTPAGYQYRKKLVNGIPERLFSVLLHYGIAIPLLWLFCTFVLGLRIKNRRVLRKIRKKGGAVTIANHVHTLDSAMCGLAVWPKKPIVTSLPANFNLAGAGFFVRALGSVPVPVTSAESRIFFYELSKRLRRGRFVHFFPEGELIQNDTHLREFKHGAFHLAVDAQVPVIPLYISIRKHRSPFIRFFVRQTIILSAGKPLYPDTALTRRDAAADLCDRTFAAMQTMADTSVHRRAFMHVH